MPEPRDMAERAEWSSEKPYVLPNWRKQQVTTSTAVAPVDNKVNVGALVTAAAPPSPPPPTPPAPVGILSTFPEQSRDSMWSLVWSQSGGDIVQAMSIIVDMQTKQLALVSARQQAEDERQRRQQQAKDERARRQQQAKDEHDARVLKMEDEKNKRHRTMNAENKLQELEYTKRRKLADVEEAIANAKLEKIKGGGAFKRSHNVISAAELVRVIRLKFDNNKFYSKCQNEGCTSNVCSARVHVVVLNSYKPQSTDDELMVSTVVACRNHKDAYDNALGSPILFLIQDKQLRTWLSNVGAGSTKGVCMLCGTGDAIDVYDFHVSHDVSQSDGGNNSQRNLWVGHAKCNLEQGTTPGDTYRSSVGGTTAVTQPTHMMGAWAIPIKTSSVVLKAMKFMKSHSKAAYSSDVVSKLQHWQRETRKKQKKLKLKKKKNLKLMLTL